MTHTQRPEWDDFAPEDGTIFPVNQSLSDFPSGILPSGESNFYDTGQSHVENGGSGINYKFPYPDENTAHEFAHPSGEPSGLYNEEHWATSGVIITRDKEEGSVNSQQSGVFAMSGEFSPFSNGTIVKQDQIEDFTIFGNYIHFERFPSNSKKDFDKKGLLQIPYISDYDVSIDWNPYKG
jgi:hypothetical protein